MHRTNLILQTLEGNNYTNTDERVIVLAFCTSPHSPLPLYQVSFIYLQYFSRYATIAKIKKGNNSVITCDRVTVLALCNFSVSHLSMYQITFNALLYFQRYAPDKLFIAKNEKESNSVNTGDRVIVLAFSNFPHGPLSVY